MNKFLNIFDRVAIILFSIFILLVTIWAIIIPITKSKSFYEYEFEKNNTSARTKYTYVYNDEIFVVQYTNEDLSIIIDNVINYLMDKNDNMQVYINDKEVFSNQALIHMKDVKNLYMKGNTLGWILFAMCILLGIYMILRKDTIKLHLFKYTMISIGSIFVLIIAYGIYALIDFYDAFDLFHVLAFPTKQGYEDSMFGNISNYDELYYVNNRTLTNILQLNIFIDAAIAIFTGAILILTSWITFGVVVNKKLKLQK